MLRRTGHISIRSRISAQMYLGREGDQAYNLFRRALSYNDIISQVPAPYLVFLDMLKVDYVHCSKTTQTLNSRPLPTSIETCGA